MSKKLRIFVSVIVVTGLVVSGYLFNNYSMSKQDSNLKEDEETAWVYPAEIKGLDEEVEEFNIAVKEASAPSADESGNNEINEDDFAANGDIILTFKDMPSSSEIANTLKISEQDITVNDSAHVATINTEDNTISDDSIRNLAEEYEFTAEADKIITLFDEDVSYETELVPNDPQYVNQRITMNQIRMPKVWGGLTGTSALKVAVIDTGINGYHQDFGNRVLAGYDYVNKHGIHSQRDSDDNGHGTAVSGIIGARGNNNIAIAGINWSVGLIPVKAFNSSGTGTTSNVISAITWAANNGANVMNMSFGGYSYSAGMESAVNYAYSKNITLVAASGNDNQDTVAYPAKYSRVIAVGAATSNSTRASFSNYGSELDIVAPGVDIRTTSDSTSGTRTASGTSLAAPFVSGTMALAQSSHPGYNQSQLKRTLTSCAEKVSAMQGANFTRTYGYGLLRPDCMILTSGDMSAQYYSLSPWNQAHNVNIYALPGDSVTTYVRMLNTGQSTWLRDGTNPVHLGVVGDERSPFLRDTNQFQNNRAAMVRVNTRPGDIGFFRFTIHVPNDPGTHTLNLQLVKEGVEWFGPVVPITIQARNTNINNATYRSQTPWNNAYQVNFAGTPGSTTTMRVTMNNTGNSTWQPGGSNPVALGVIGDQVGFGLLKFQRKRAAYVGSSTSPGGRGTFTFRVAIPSWAKSGQTYYTNLQLVKEGVEWFGPRVVISFRVL